MCLHQQISRLGHVHMLLIHNYRDACINDCSIASKLPIRHVFVVSNLFGSSLSFICSKLEFTNDEN